MQEAVYIEVFRQDIQTLIQFFPLSLDVPVKVRETMAVGNILVITANDLCQRNDLFRVLHDRLRPPEFKHQVYKRLYLLVVRLLPGRIERIDPQRAAAVIINMQRPVRVQLRKLVKALSELDDDLFIILLDVLLDDVQRRNRLSPTRRCDDNHVTCRDAFLICVPNVLSDRRLIQPFVKQDPLLVAAERRVIDPHAERRMQIRKKQVVRIQVVFPADDRAYKDIIKPLVTWNVIFKPGVRENHFYLFRLSVQDRFVILQQQHVQVRFAKHVFLVDDLLLIRGQAVITAFYGLVKLPVTAEQLHPLGQFLPVASPGEFPYLVYHMGTGHMNADPFQHRHIKLAVCLLQSAVRNIYFHPVGQIPFITNGKEYPFLLPDPYHIGTLYIP